jgi:hypothetical protein
MDRDIFLNQNANIKMKDSNAKRPRLTKSFLNFDFSF